MNTVLPAPRRGALVALMCLAACAALATASGASADTAPIQVGNGALPWTDPNHQSPLEVLGSQIASHVANRSVAIRCEGQNDWDILNSQIGADGLEGGYVAVNGWTFGGNIWLPKISGFAEMSPTVCLALQNFAIATAKPTKCSQTTTQMVAGTTTVKKTKKVRVHVKVRTQGHTTWKWVTKFVTTTVRVPTQTPTQVTGPPGPCYAHGSQLPMSDPAFWTAYQGYAYAILTLAHESIHLGGAFGNIGTFNGYPLGDQLAEIHAQCYGTQWMPWVAEQLGATPDDALAIAQWTYNVLYPRYQGTTHKGATYWSADCVPGGSLDIRADKSGSWP